MYRRITFSTYPSLKDSFNQRCQSMSRSMSSVLEEYTRKFLENKLGELDNIIQNSQMQKKPQERRDYKLTVTMDEMLYFSLKTKLESLRIRPASFLSLLMGYVNTVAVTSENYSQKAKELLEHSNYDITHVVYGLRYYKPIPKENSTEIVATEFFLDPCTEQRFQEYYAMPNPLIFVYAVHRP